MKSYNEFYKSEVITESSDDKKFLDNNKGREGKTLLGVDGKEIAGKIYLGKGSYAYKDNASIKLVMPTGQYGKNETTIIYKETFEILKKVF